jgi:diguanylate cyclase (GGDEF)-like protein
VVKLTSAAEADLMLPGIGIAYEKAGVHAVIAVPIMDRSDPIGVVACYFTHPREFDEQADPLARALAQQAAQAFIRIRLSDELRRAAMRDALTGLPSRRLFEEQMERALARQTDLSAVLFIDLDGFKAINDRLGHTAGDELLGQVGDRLRRVFREDDAVARWGGDEFIAVFEVHDRAAAIQLAERAREVLAEPFASPLGAQVTASIGLVLSSIQDGVAVERLIRLADQAMYSAKAAGGNQVVLSVDLDHEIDGLANS